MKICIKKFNDKTNTMRIDEICKAIGNGIIIKGAREINRVTKIIYIIDNKYNNLYQSVSSIDITKIGNKRNTKLTFMPWGSVSVIDGCIQSGNINMANDNKKYEVFIRVQ